MSFTHTFPGQEKLQQSNEDLLKLVLECKDYAIMLLDTSGYIQNWNRGLSVFMVLSRRMRLVSIFVNGIQGKKYEMMSHG